MKGQQRESGSTQSTFRRRRDESFYCSKRTETLRLADPKLPFHTNYRQALYVIPLRYAPY